MKLQSPRSSRVTAGKPSSTYPESDGKSWLLSEAPPKARPAFDLEERTAVFDEAIVRFVKKVPRGPENDRLIDQLVGCGTSIGANYCEASEGVSKKRFPPHHRPLLEGSQRNEILSACNRGQRARPDPEARNLFREAKELHLIFCSMYRNAG
ncbi:MAG TPA: four helix bundle protein [Opitutus sp.]|nr:four helix bundle protein [Opitutus sp.]